MRIAVSFVILLVLALPVRADVVYLEDGTVIEGRVEDLGDKIRIHRAGGSVTIPKTLVSKIVKKKTAEEVYEEKSKALKDDDLAGHEKLARWCEEKKLKDQAGREWRKILEIDTDHEEARKALGYRKWKDKWMTEDEVNTAKGLVKYKGKWMTPAEKVLAGRIDKNKELEKELAREVRRLLRLTHSPNEEKKKEAVEKLAAIDDKYKTKPFLSSISKSFTDTRLYVVRELGRMKEPKAMKPLTVRVLYDKEEEIRTEALKSLKLIGDKTTHKEFIKKLTDAQDIVRFRAIEALADFPDWESVGPVIAILAKDVKSMQFIKKYAENMGRILAGKLVTKDGKHVPLPPGTRINAQYFDKEGMARLQREIDSCRATIRAITGHDYGEDLKRWAEWYEKEKKERAKSGKKK